MAAGHGKIIKVPDFWILIYFFGRLLFNNKQFFNSLTRQLTLFVFVIKLIVKNNLFKQKYFKQ